MQKPLIKLRFQNGLNFTDFGREVFAIEGLDEHFHFIESDEPDFIIFGPYGNDLPQPGNYIRVGYHCENFTPDLTICDWAFGVPLESEINHPRYKRIQWHGTDPQSLIKPADYDAAAIAGSKTGFCNFLYSHKVPYREYFFKQLSKYKKVDAPGRSMNNMPGIDSFYTGTIWERKGSFLGSYKFTIAFENDIYPGYQTEKLYDAMQANSIPIYCGDPYVGEIFNTASFINAGDLIDIDKGWIAALAKASQPDFNDIRPSFYHTIPQRIKRKLKTVGREAKVHLQLDQKAVNKMVDRVIELDSDSKKYREMLAQPWFIGNEPPLNGSSKERWIKIFSEIKHRDR